MNNKENILYYSSFCMTNFFPGLLLHEQTQNNNIWERNYDLLPLDFSHCLSEMM